jgi:ATP-dependent RNA helicase RhlE
MTQTFESLGLSERTIAALKHLGYEQPTPVQIQAIPLVLEGRDIIAAAKTGTGKTAAFSLPAMDTLGHIQRGQGPLMLVVTPTRELALQIAAVCETIARATHHRIACVVGGVSYDPQINHLKRGVDILIATPGRLIDLIDRDAARLDHVGVFVLDEADRMLDMGFWPSVKKIAAKLPAKRQTLLFSATIDRSVTDSVGILLHDPAFVEIAHKGETADTVDQYIIHTTTLLKPELLKALAQEKGAQRVIVFARTRSRVDSCTRRLKKAGFSVEALHSDRSQAQRKRALDNFDSGKTDILVATDVLARGIDVSEVSYVVNYDLPNQAEDYIHRIGRTGRAGESGFSVSFVSPEQLDWLHDIEKLIKRKIPEMALDAFDEAEAAERVAARAGQQAALQAARLDPELAAAAKEHAARQKSQKKKGSQGTAGTGPALGADKPGAGKGGNNRKANKKGGKGQGAGGQDPAATHGQPQKGATGHEGTTKGGGNTGNARKGTPWSHQDNSPKGARKGGAGHGSLQTQPKPSKSGTKGHSGIFPSSSGNQPANRAQGRPSAKAGPDLRPGRARRAALAKHRGAH